MSTAEDIPRSEEQSIGIGHNTRQRSESCLPPLKDRRCLKDQPITEEELLRACEVVSLIIEAYGDAYWPILDRLETELETLLSRTSRISKYKTSGKSIKRPRRC